jgi:hypothetical protein
MRLTNKSLVSLRSGVLISICSEDGSVVPTIELIFIVVLTVGFFISGVRSVTDDGHIVTLFYSNLKAAVTY